MDINKISKPLPGQYLFARFPGKSGITMIRCYGFCIEGGDENTVHFKDNDGRIYIRSLSEFEWKPEVFKPKN